jgi:hypothetical protein
MPAVQTAFGPLVEPGWPTTMGTQPDFAKSLSSGFELAATLKGKQLALQNQMFNNLLKMQAMDNEMANNKTKAEIAVQKLTASNELGHERLEAYKERGDNIAIFAREREDRLHSLVDEKIKDKQKSDEASFELNMLPQQLASEGFTPGTEEYYNQLRARSAPHLAVLQPSLRKSAESGILSKYKDDRSFNLKQLESDERAFAHEYGREVTGDDLNIDTYPMYHPDKLPDQKTGGYFWTDIGAKTTGKKLVKGIDPSTGQPGDRPIAVQRLTDFKTRYEKLIKRREKLGPDVNRPDLGIHGIDPNKKPVRVISPDGTHGSIPGDAVDDYVNNRGYQLETPGQ